MLITLSRALSGALLLAGISAKWTGEHQDLAAALLVAQTEMTAIDADGSLLPIEYHDEIEIRICRVTAYCDRGTTAAGIPSGVGQCAGPADLPFGTEIHIPALNRTYIVTDRTARRFRHNTVDLFIPDREDCLEFGLNYLECEIRLPVVRPRYGAPQLAAAAASVHGADSATAVRFD